MAALSTALSVSSALLASAILIQSSALYYLYRKLRTLMEKCEEVAQNCVELRDDVHGLRQRLKWVEGQLPTSARPTVTFAAPTPMSRVTSIASSAEWEDALEEWPSPDDTAALLPPPPANNSGGGGGGGSSNFDEVDRLHEEGEAQQAYDQLKRCVEAEPRNVEALWRFARACHALGQRFGQRSTRRRDLVQEGHRRALVAYGLADRHFQVVKWTAVLTGALTDFLGTRERIQLGFQFKAYLDRGLALQPDEYSLLHMRARFSHSVAQLSWLERKAAAAFFATPPQATLDDALRDFLQVEKLKPDWLENQIYLARTYLAMGNKERARHYYELCAKAQPSDDADKEIIEEAKKALKSL